MMPPAARSMPMQARFYVGPLGKPSAARDKAGVAKLGVHGLPLVGGARRTAAWRATSVPVHRAERDAETAARHAAADLPAGSIRFGSEASIGGSGAHQQRAR